MERQHKHNGDKKSKKRKKSKSTVGDISVKELVPNGESKLKKKSKKKEKSKDCGNDTTEISLLLDAILAPYISDDGSVSCKKLKKRKDQDTDVDHCNKTDTDESLVKKKGKKRREKSEQRDEKSKGELTKELTAPCSGGGTSNEKSAKRKDVTQRGEFGDLLIIHPDPYKSKSVKKENMKKNSKDVENPSSCKTQQDVSAAGPSSSEQDSCASTSKHSDASVKPVRRYRPAQEVLNTDDFTEEQRRANEYVLSGKYLPTISECLNNDFGEGHRPFVPTFKGDPICPYCHKAFVKSFWRDHHVRSVHLKIKRHKCNWCGQRFSETETLKGHEYIHMDARPFPCRFCDKVYRYSSHMMRCRRSHMRQWSVVLDGMESKRRKRKNAKELDSKEEEEELNVRESSEESEDESDLVGKLINGQSEVFNNIKESFCVK